MNLFKIAFFVFLLISINSFSQNESKLDSTISLENFDYDLVNKTVLFYTNIHRKNKRRKVLTYNKNLEKSASVHSLQMNKYNFFDHINKYNKNLRNLEDRAILGGYSKYKKLAENLYYGYIDLRNLPTYREISIEITKAFVESRSHDLNLLDKNLKNFGCALVFKNKSKNGFLHYYFTESFGSY